MPPRASARSKKTVAPGGLAQSKLDFRTGRGSQVKEEKAIVSKDISSPAGISTESGNNGESKADKRPVRFRPFTKKRKLDDAGSYSATPSWEETSTPAEVERPRLNADDARWSKLYGETRNKMGNLQPLHSEKLNKVHHILRLFDLSYEYGPCIGVTRLERWERAEALGLNPPSEVKAILVTKEGWEDKSYKHSVFNGGEES